MNALFKISSYDFSISKYITKHIKIYKKILDLKMYEPIYRIAIYK
jgi:hypothetical protein